MRISDWSSDVCSSDLVGGAQVDPEAPRNAAVDRPRAAIGRGRAGFFGERKPLHLDIALHQRTEGARKLGADLAEPGLDISDDFGAALIIVGKFRFGVLGEGVYQVADRTQSITPLLKDRVHP